jgi:MoxR-like ATPase
VVLADEINRATPRTQAALLEAMAESCVTVDGTTHVLQPPFWVIATQNPIDHEGTFPLPEAQLDRFLVRFSLGYPSMEEELRMLDLLERGHPLDRLEPVVSADDLVAVQRAVQTVHVDPRVRRYIIQIVQDTRECDDVSLGGSPRASLALFRTSQALAAVSGRNFVRPDDVKQMTGPVLNHRVILRPESRLRKLTPAAVVSEIVANVPVPMIAEDTET